MPSKTDKISFTFRPPAALMQNVETLRAKLVKADWHMGDVSCNDLLVWLLEYGIADMEKYMRDVKKQTRTTNRELDRQFAGAVKARR